MTELSSGVILSGAAFQAERRISREASAPERRIFAWINRKII